MCVIVEEFVVNFDKLKVFIEKIDIVGFGFINFYMNNFYLIEFILMIVKVGEVYG